jgi:hypothetical protein
MSPYLRGKVMGMAIHGVSPTEIALGMRLDRGTVSYTILQDDLRDEGKTLPKAPRRKSYTPYDERHLLRHVRLFPKDTYAQVIKACGLGCRKSTVKKILAKYGIANWRAKKRPLLTEEHAAKRLAWCLAHRDWNAEDWGMVVWSDECSVERGRGKRDEWVFRTLEQKWQVGMVQTYGTNKNMKTMVWGAFWDHGRSPLYIMDRDFESKKHGYSANSYLEVLDNSLLPIFQGLEPGYEFMQDNASIHRANTVKAWFKAKGIRLVVNWPPYSPDLNPIEHI